VTEDEKKLVTDLIKAAWREGFQAARRYPNHPLPLVTVSWDGMSPSTDVHWSHRVRGYIG